MRTVFRERSSRNRSKIYILLDVLVCSIAEYFNDLCRILTASKQTRSLSAHFSHGGKSKADRKSTARCRLLKQFLTVQKNQLSKKPYNIAGYLYSTGALFVRYFVQLDNKSVYFCAKWRLMCFLSFKYFATRGKNVKNSLPFAPWDVHFSVFMNKQTCPFFCNNHKILSCFLTYV